MKQQQDDWSSLIDQPQDGDGWDTVLGAGDGWDSIIEEPRQQAFTEANPKLSTAMGMVGGMPGEAAAYQRIYKNKAITLREKAAKGAAYLVGAMVGVRPDKISGVVDASVGFASAGARSGTIPPLEDIQEAAKDDPFIAKLLDVFTADKAMRDSVFSWNLAKNIVLNPPSEGDAEPSDERSALLSSIGEWNRSSPREREMETLRIGDAPPNSPVPSEDPAIRAAYDMAHQETSLEVGPVLGEEDVARKVFQYVAAQEADALATFDKDHPYQAAGMRLAGGAGSFAVDMAEAAIATSMLGAVAPALTVESALKAGVRPVRAVFRQAVQWSTFEAARQINAISNGKQEEIDPATFAENVVVGVFGGTAARSLKSPWKQALVAQVLTMIPGLGRDIVRSTGHEGERLTTDQIIARAIEALGTGVLAAVMHPIAPGVTRGLKTDFIKAATADGVPAEIANHPMLKQIVEKLSSPEAETGGVSFTGAELVFANTIAKQGWIAPEIPLRMVATPEPRIDLPAWNRGDRGAPPDGIGTRDTTGEMAQRREDVARSRAARDAGEAEALPLARVKAAEESVLDRLRAERESSAEQRALEQVIAAQKKAGWDEAVRQYEADQGNGPKEAQASYLRRRLAAEESRGQRKRPLGAVEDRPAKDLAERITALNDGDAMRRLERDQAGEEYTGAVEYQIGKGRRKRGTSGQVYIPTIDEIFFDPAWPQERVDAFRKASSLLAGRFVQSAGRAGPEMEEMLSPFTGEVSLDPTMKEMQAQLKHANFRQTLDALKYGLLRDKVVIGTLRSIVGQEVAQRIGDAMFRSRDSADVARMRKEVSGLLQERSEFSAVQVKYDQLIGQIAGTDRYIRERLNAIVGHRVNGRTDPLGETIPTVDPAAVEKLIGLGVDAAKAGRAFGVRAKDLELIAEGEYVTDEGKRVKVYKSQFDSGEFSREDPPGKLIDGYNAYLTDNAYYWPRLMKKKTVGSFIRNFLPGSAHSPELSGRKLHQADTHFRSRNLIWEEFLEVGGDPSFERGFSAMMKQVGALHQAEMLSWAETNKIIRTPQEVEGAVADPASTEALVRLKETASGLRRGLKELHSKFHLSSSEVEKATILKDIINNRTHLVNEVQNIKNLQLSKNPAGWRPLGKEFGKKYEGKLIRSDFWYELTEGPQTSGNIASFLGGIQAAMAGNVTYRDVLRHLPQDWLSNLQQMSFGGTRPFSAEGIATQAKMTKYVWDATKGNVAPDPVFREWLGLILGGDRVSGAGQFTRADIERVDRYIAQADDMASRGNRAGAAAARLGGAIVHLNKAFERASGLQFGSKIGRMSDLVPSASFWYMLRTGAASDFGFKMSSDEASIHHDTYFSYSNVAPVVAMASRYANFMRYPFKSAVSSVEYAATKPMAVKVPFGPSLKFDFPVLDKAIHANPGSGKAVAAMTARAAVNLSASMALKVAPFLAVRLYALSRLGSSSEEFDKELDRSLSWMPSYAREGVKLFTIPWAKEKDGSFRYFDFSSWVPWMALPKYMSMPVGAVTGHQSLGSWLMSKNILATSVGSAFGVDYKGDMIGGDTRAEVVAKRAWAATSALLPGMVTTPIKGAMRLYDDMRDQDDISVLDAVSKMAGTLQSKQTMGGVLALRYLTDQVQAADMQGLLEEVVREDGRKWLEVREPEKYPRLVKQLAAYYRVRAMQPEAARKRVERKRRAYADAAASIGKE